MDNHYERKNKDQLANLTKHSNMCLCLHRKSYPHIQWKETLRRESSTQTNKTVANE